MTRHNKRPLGRPPTPVQLQAMGHPRLTPLQAIRARCLDCSGHIPAEVAACAAIACPAWPFRFGKNPWNAATPEQRAASKRNARFLRHARDSHDVADAQRPGGEDARQPAPHSGGRENDEA